MNRCGECDACRRVAVARRSVLRVANPPFSHASTETVVLWNQILADNICERATNEERERELQQFAALPPTVRPDIPVS